MGLRHSKRCSRSKGQLDVFAGTEFLKAIRSRLLLALVIVACKGDDNQGSAAPSSSPVRGPDAIILRIPRTGGSARASLLGSPDSIVWRSAATANVSRILGFDADAGVIAFVDARGLPSRMDLRSGEIRNASRLKLLSLAAAPGSDIYGVDAKGGVARLSPAGGEWTFKPAIPATVVFPENDGSLVVAGGNNTTTSLWLLRPPDDSVLAVAKLSNAFRTISAHAGDRLYFAAGNQLVGVRTKNLQTVSPIRLPDKPTVLQPTPSGDRIYVAFAKRAEIAVVDRYTEKISEWVKLPAAPTHLRMDPLGRYLIARNPAEDSIWVMAIGTNRLLESQASKWTSDLPAFAPDGRLALAHGADVVFVEPETNREVRTIRNGARDFWYFFTWNGFRPRAAGVDEPVTFGSGDSIPPGSTIAPDTVAPDSSQTTASADTVPPSVSARQFTVSFAALLRESSARDLSSTIAVNGIHPKVIATVKNNAPIYRVVLGPFASREEAEKAGRQSGKSYWVYEGYP